MVVQVRVRLIGEAQAHVALDLKQAAIGSRC